MSENKAGKFRRKKIYFTQVSNVALRDPNLSAKAKGLYSLIQSFLTLEDFTLYKNTLRKYLKEGDKAFESIWKELKDTGYLIQYRLRGDKGSFYYEYELLDESDIALANEVHASQNRKKQDKKNHTPKKVCMDKKQKNHTPKKDVMDNGEYGKGGGYNNTNLNNTNLNNTNTSSSSSSSIESLVDIFKDNICKLRKTTKTKFLKLIKTESTDYVKAVIEYQSDINTKSYAGFEKGFKNFESNNIHTIEDLKIFLENYNKNKLKKTYKKKEKKDLRFNDFPQREYSDDFYENLYENLNVSKDYEVSEEDPIKEYLKNKNNIEV